MRGKKFGEEGYIQFVSWGVINRVNVDGSEIIRGDGDASVFCGGLDFMSERRVV